MTVPQDFSLLDAAAVATFAAAWLIYYLLFDGRLLRPTSLNARMTAVREAWMRTLLVRSNRMMDSLLIGHTMHSATFFASSSIIVLIGLVGLLGAGDRILGGAAGVGGIVAHSFALFQVKLTLLIAIFVYAFFKFTWAIRHLNYFCAIMGSVPEAGSQPADGQLAWRMAHVLGLGMTQLNAGVRALYFALAALCWFIHPIAFMVMTVVMTGVLARRQLRSPIALAIAAHVQTLPSQPSREAGDKP